MKRFNWLLIGLMVLCLAMVPLAGCGVPKSEYEALQTEYDKLSADYDGLKANHEAVNKELAEIKEVYPPRHFSPFKELQDWLLANDVSDRPPAEYAEGSYGKALDIQADALKDGYIVSASIDFYYETEEFVIWCVAVADGNVWIWDPETDELVDFSGVSGLLKVR